MAHVTLDRSPPPFFRQGASALSKLLVFSALALFLMVADARFRLTQPIRIAVASVLYPMQWMLVRPVLWVQNAARHFETLTSAQNEAEVALQKLRLQSYRATQVEQLSLENVRLRNLLELRERITTPARAAQVLYDAADPYTRKVIIDKGLLHGIVAGSPVLDESGVLGQVTRVYPSVSEVTLVIDADQAIPVLNTRTGVRAVAFGDPGIQAGALELRFMATNADVQPGDLLTTSGVDGVYPPGLPVARVDKVERRVESAFARIYCTPQALVEGASYVMVLEPVSSQMTARPVPEEVPLVVKKGRQK
jgi:rod shape-determining protein MreC